MTDHHSPVLESQAGAGHVAHRHRDAVDALDNDLLDFFRAAILPQGPGDVATLALVEITGTDGLVFDIL